MKNVSELKKWYISNFKTFEASLNGGSKHPFHELRKTAIEEFESLNFPTIKDEEWKYTNVSPVLNYYFKVETPSSKISKDDVKKFLFDDEFTTLVFINGKFSAELSGTNKKTKDAIITNLSDAIKEHPELIEKHLGKYADYKENAFTALSTAFTNDGTFIYVEKGKIIKNPVQILYLTDGASESAFAPRNLFIAEDNAQFKVVELYAGLNSNVYFNNSITEIVAGESAVIEHVKIQDEALDSFHISNTQIVQERNSNVSSYNVNFGGKLVRNNINSRFNGTGGECTLNGLYLTKGEQLVDNHTMIDHAQPHCLSHELYKGILTEKSHGVFNGKIYVRPDAQKTNAFQENKNLLLSNDALINAKPQLEIFADDVKCTHGATVGRLDENALFYLRSRGIGEKEARATLIYAFASDVVHSIKITQVRDRLEEMLADKLL
jgi:Fe-S cluster assembly protein SufD